MTRKESETALHRRIREGGYVMEARSPRPRLVFVLFFNSRLFMFFSCSLLK